MNIATDLKTLRPIIDQYYFEKREWVVPWNRIKFVWDGWYLNFLRKYSRNTIGAAWLLKSPWEIHLLSSYNNTIKLGPLVAHEIAHVWQREKKGFMFYLQYAWDLLMFGRENLYRDNKIELEAREIEEDFAKYQNNLEKLSLKEIH
jgi:hypothetical protein